MECNVSPSEDKPTNKCWLVPYPLLTIARRSITAETALITGASGGIGLHLAHDSAQNGHPLVITAPARLSSNALAKNSTLNVTIRVIAGDFERPDATQEIFDELQSSGVEVDILSIMQVMVSTANGGNCRSRKIFR